MRKAKKRVLGLCGLSLVAGMTAVAATLPGPKASATGDVTTVTDTLSVRVVGAVPKVDILGIDNGEVIVVPTQSFTVEYENVDELTVVLTHTDLDGNVTEYTLDETVPDYYPGSEDYTVNFVK